MMHSNARVDPARRLLTTFDSDRHSTRQRVERTTHKTRFRVGFLQGRPIRARESSECGRMLSMPRGFVEFNRWPFTAVTSDALSVHNAKDGAMMLAGRVDTKPAEAIPWGPPSA